MKKLFAVVALGLVFTLSACTTGTSTSGTTGETKVYTHEKGETEVPMNPESVVVFDWAAVDTMVELGVDEAITGVPQSGVPSYLNQFTSSDYTNVGSAKEADLEAIAALNPELIIITGRQAELYDQLAEIAPTLYLGMDYTDYMASFETNVNILGEIFGASEQAATAIADVQTKVEAVAAKTATMTETALVTLANDGKVSAYGNDSRFGLIFETFGLTNADETIEASTHGQSVSFEYLLATNPDLIYVIDRSAVVGGASSAQELFNNEVVNQTTAAKNGNIVYLTAEYWYISTGGLHAVNKMIEEIAVSIEGL
ncbi:MAG: siderophore ABC transporter substrate-binding protein [Culicoidibacterales bacterium]